MKYIEGHVSVLAFVLLQKFFHRFFNKPFWDMGDTMLQQYKLWVNLFTYTQNKQYTPITSAIPQRGLCDCPLAKWKWPCSKITFQARNMPGYCLLNICQFVQNSWFFMALFPGMIFFLLQSVFWFFALGKIRKKCYY